MARGRIVTRTGRSKRQVTWVGPADQNTVAVATGASVIVASFNPFTGASMHKPTVVRTRGEVSVRPSSFAADTVISGAMGVCVVSDEAFTAGAGSIPRPFDDAGWDGWFVWQSFVNRYEVLSADGVIIPAAIAYQIDSKAMRKVSDNETIVLMAESQLGALEVGMHLRLLMKLS